MKLRVSLIIASLLLCLGSALGHAPAQDGRFAAAGGIDADVEKFFTDFREAMPRGEIWFAGFGRAKGDGTKSIKIIAINGPIR